MAANTKDFKPQTLAIDAHTCCFYSALNVQSMVVGCFSFPLAGHKQNSVLRTLFYSSHPLVQGHPEHRAMLPVSKQKLLLSSLTLMSFQCKDPQNKTVDSLYVAILLALLPPNGCFT